MDQKIFFIILIVFLLTSEFYFMVRNIIKYGIYLILIIYIIKIINPDTSFNIKTFTNTLINSDENSIMSNISSLIKIIKKFFNISNFKMFDNLFDAETTMNKFNEFIYVDIPDSSNKVPDSSNKVPDSSTSMSNLSTTITNSSYKL